MTEKRLETYLDGKTQAAQPKLSARHVLAENLRIIRLVRRLSQEALAEVAGLDRSYLGGIERAERNLSIDNLEKLARALDVTVLELLREPDPRQVAHQLLDSVRNAVEGASRRAK